MNIEYHGPWPREVKIGKNGVVETSKTVEMKGVTPEMLDWFNKNLDLELYLKWHPDHIDRKKIERPGKSPIFLETQRVGNKVYKMRLKRSERLPDGTHVSRLRYPLWVFHSESKTVPTPTGVIRYSKGWVGTDFPVVGRLWNWYLRLFVLPDFMKRQFQHQDEESVNTVNVLPRLYAEYMKKQRQG